MEGEIYIGKISRFFNNKYNVLYRRTPGHDTGYKTGISFCEMVAYIDGILTTPQYVKVKNGMPPEKNNRETGPLDDEKFEELLQKSGLEFMLNFDSGEIIE